MNVLFVALFLECFMTCFWSVVTAVLAVLFTSNHTAIPFSSATQFDVLFAILC